MEQVKSLLLYSYVLPVHVCPTVGINVYGTHTVHKPHSELSNSVVVDHESESE